MTQITMKPRIYLAGKIAKNDWRHTLVPELRTEHWHDRSVIVMDRFDYVGPFFISDDHGCAHGRNKHGVLDACPTSEEDPVYDRNEIFEKCIRGIERCDLVFAYITSHDAFGTFFEIGLAHKAGKRIVLCFASNINIADFWFLAQGASRSFSDIAEPELPHILRREVNYLRGKP